MELRNKQVIIETTNICDAHCVICPREQFKSKLRMMDLGLFKKIIDDAVQYDVDSIDTCGFGEAFLDKYIWERFAYVREKLPKAKIFVSTTGYHLDPDKWDKTVELIDILKLSIYGVTKETYEAFHRGRIQYDVVMKNLYGFLDYIRPMAKKPHTAGLFVSHEINRHEQEDWLNKWKPLLDEVSIWKPHNWVDARAYRTIDKTHQVSCCRPFNAPLYVHANGIVSPCCWDIHERIPLGDMNTQTIEEIYKGEPYRKLREAHHARDFSDYICKDCDQTNFREDVLIYSSNSDRKVGQLTSNERMIFDAEESPVNLCKCNVGNSSLPDDDCRCVQGV